MIDIHFSVDTAVILIVALSWIALSISQNLGILLKKKTIGDVVREVLDREFADQFRQWKDSVESRFDELEKDEDSKS